MQPKLLIRRHRSASHITVGGNVDADSAEAFAIVLKHDVRVLADGDERIQLDLSDLELDDGSAVAETVNAIRELLELAPVLVSNAPQMLAHTLYKVGLLEGGRLTLHEPRADEVPYS
jgi:anti-anti-sigma regulatory factor